MLAVPFKISKNVEELRRALKDAPLFMDTETNFFYRSIRLVQCYQEGWSEVILFDVRDTSLKEVYEAVKDCHVVFHNYTYDATSFEMDLKLGENPFKNFDDTFLLSRQCFAREKFFNLAACFSYVLGYDPYEKTGLDKSIMQKTFLSTKRVDMSKAELTQDQLNYAAIDVYYMPLLWKVVKDYRSIWYYKVDKEFTSNLIRWQRFGMPVRKDVLALERNRIFGISEKYRPILKDINVASVKQVREATGLQETSYQALQTIANKGDKLAEAIIEERSARALHRFLDRYEAEDRVKGFFSPSVVSGRVKCEGGKFPGEDNLMQVPRELKYVFGFTESDTRYLVDCDYAQLELRSACCLVGEENLQEAFLGGVDLHAYTASKMFKVSLEEAKKDDARKPAKVCNFSMLYCGSSNVLCRAFERIGLNVSTDEAVKYRSMWLDSYPAIKRWHNEAMTNFSKGNMLVTTPNGRSYTAKLFTDICGVCNQSLGADATKQSLNILLRKKPDTKVLNFVHDSITLEASSLEEARELSRLLGESMIEGWFRAIEKCKINDLPMPVEVDICKQWGKPIEVGYTNPGTLEDLKSFTAPIKADRKLLFEEYKISTNPTFESYVCLHDADTLFYKTAYEAENDDWEFAKTLLQEKFRFLRSEFKPGKLINFLGDPDSKCFRYEVDPEYKLRRKSKASKRPKYLNDLKRYALDNFTNCKSNPILEADDLVTYYKSITPNSIIWTIDKDILKGVEGRHFDMYHFKFVETSLRESLWFHYYQVLKGDSSDSIKGLEGIGDKKAKSILDFDWSYENDLWEAVLKVYKERGYTEQDLIKNMRLVRMDQWDGRQIKLWNPTKIV